VSFHSTAPSISVGDDSLIHSNSLSHVEPFACPKNVKVRLDDTPNAKHGSSGDYTTSAIAVFKERDIFLYSSYRRSPENVRKESAMFAADYARAATHAFVCDMSGKKYGAHSLSPEKYEDKAVLVCRKEKKLKTNDSRLGEEYASFLMHCLFCFFPIFPSESIQFFNFILFYFI
jgi:hypothetical protein